MNEIHELYGGEVKLKYKEWENQGRTTHGYWVLEPSEEAGRKPGVTSALGVIAKPVLMQYAANKAVEVFADNHDPKRAWSKARFNKIAKDAKYAHRTYSTDRADIGTAIHNWIENHLKGKDGKVTPEMKLGVDSYLEFEETYKPTYRFSERVIYSRKHGYCGRVDAGVELDGYGILDFKTGKPDKEYNSYSKQYTGKYRAYSEHLAQDAGYDIAIAEEDGEHADWYGVLYLDALSGDKWFFRTDKTVEFRTMYESALMLHRTKTEIDRKLNAYE